MQDLKPECLLPVLVVSAKDENSAKSIITEIIDNSKTERSSEDTTDNVWSLVNKYYSADVRLLALLDGQELDPQMADSVEGHLIYMTEDECRGADAADVMRRRARLVGSASVRVVAADVADAPRLAGPCAAERLELVPLREAPAADDECGLRRVRAAFHAHVWPGLVRAGCDDTTESNREVVTDSSEEEDEWSEWCSAERVENVEGEDDAFSAALASLPAAAAAARGAGGGREERLARAEQLVAAFCRALGTPLD